VVSVRSLTTARPESRVARNLGPSGVWPAVRSEQRSLGSRMARIKESCELKAMCSAIGKCGRFHPLRSFRRRSMRNTKHLQKIVLTELYKMSCQR
jgi:hypothetical protein